MAKLVKIINLIYFFFLIFSLIFFSYQFLKNLVSIETFVKVFGFSIGSIFILLFSYKNSKEYFDSAIKSMDIKEEIAMPPIMLVFLGGFSVALSITFIAFLQALGILFIVKTIESLILNILALVSFFWLAFILFMGWDFIKIAGVVSQYSLIKEKKTNFLKNMKYFFENMKSLRNAFLAFAVVDLACRSMPKISRTYYKNLLYPVKIWCACLTLYENKSVTESLREAFEYFKTKSFKMFYTSNLVSFFLPLIVVPIGLSLGIIISNIEYFSNPQCFLSNCFFLIIFFLIFMALGFYFSYSISISLESAYYVKVLSDIKEGKVINSFKQYRRIKYIEEESYRKISELKGNFLDILRIYF